MAWVRIDDRFPDNPKIVAAGEAAAYLYVTGLCYCNRELTNGFIPLAQVDRLVALRQDQHIHNGPLQLARRLCGLGLWMEGERKGVAGFVVHDYLKYQPSKKQVLADRAKVAERVGRFRNGPRNGVGNGVSNGVTPPVGNAPRNGVSNAAPNPNPKVQKQPSVVVPPNKPADPRVREFLQWFQAEYTTRRHGAEYLVSWAKHGAIVKELLHATDLDRLKKYAQILLSDKTDDEFIVATDRGIEVLRAKFSWLSDRLAAWETRQRPVPA